MNPKGLSDEASRGKEALSSENTPSTSYSVEGSCGDDEMKRAAAKLIEKYFYQLLDGCGNTSCDNKYCASSGEARNMTPNEAAAEAIKLFYFKAKLCDSQPSKIPRTESNSVPTTASSTSSTLIIKDEPTSKAVFTSKPENKTSQKLSQDEIKSNIPSNGVPLTEARIRALCQEFIETKSSKNLMQALWEAISQPAILAKSFPFEVPQESPGKEEAEADSSMSDPDKDVDSVCGPGLDVASCRRAFQHLSKLPAEFPSSILATVLANMAQSLEIDLRIMKQLPSDVIVNCFVIAFEVPDLSSSSCEYFDITLPALCQAADSLSVKDQAKLARMWATHGKDSLKKILETLQQLITLRVYSENYSQPYCVQEDETVTMATKVLKILYYANLLAGVVEPNTLREETIVIPNHMDSLADAIDHLYPVSVMHGSKNSQPDDPLGKELNVNVLDARKPYLPFEDFYNELLSDTIEMDIDFANYKGDSSGRKFAFMRYPFILTSATKSLGLYYENRIRMYSERRVSLIHAVVGATAPMPFLKLKVRRSHIIDDALVELEMISMERAQDLKKQLVVEFEGEQGVDEGGVSKEFFQLIVEEIFNPDYGMFTHQPDTHTVWFNTMSYETEAQFTLIGIVLGLAIYNNVILAVNFPMVVYRKLMGKKGSFEDLADWNPTLYNGLKDLLEYLNTDMEEVYMQTFRVCYQDVFGNNIFHELKDNGDSIFVNQENKREFVDLYADFLLNKSIETQFKAFRRGFLMVTDESPLGALFRPEEVETLVCGSKNFDFNELEKSTEYDGGYRADSQTIKDFWEIVHNLTLDDKRKLLQFTTGSDRVPVGGLSHLKLVIARNGPDSDRLPTAHTCFNVLLLPEYDSKEKLNDRLMKAISYSKGFGML